MKGTIARSRFKGSSPISTTVQYGGATTKRTVQSERTLETSGGTNRGVGDGHHNHQHPLFYSSTHYWNIRNLPPVAYSSESDDESSEGDSMIDSGDVDNKDSQ